VGSKEEENPPAPFSKGGKRKSPCLLFQRGKKKIPLAPFSKGRKRNQLLYL